MGNFFSEPFFAPLVYVQGVMGIVLSYVCWGTHRPPLPPRDHGG